MRRPPMRSIAASRRGSDRENRSASVLIRAARARGTPTARRHRASYASRGVPFCTWSAAASPAIRPAIMDTLIPPPFVAMTWPAASPARITGGATVRSPGPTTGAGAPGPPAPVAPTRPARRLRPQPRPLRARQVRDPLVHPVALDREPAEGHVPVPAPRGPETEDRGVVLFHAMRDRPGVVQVRNRGEDRADLVVACDVLPALHGHADDLAAIEEQNVQPAPGRVPCGRASRRPCADHDHAVRARTP